jgi:hypothetical protein
MEVARGYLEYECVSWLVQRSDSPLMTRLPIIRVAE